MLRLELRMSLLDLVVLRLQRADRLPRRLHLLLGGPFRCLCIRLRLGELRLDVVQLRLAVGELGARRGGIVLGRLSLRVERASELLRNRRLLAELLSLHDCRVALSACIVRDTRELVRTRALRLHGAACRLQGTLAIRDDRLRLFDLLRRRGRLLARTLELLACVVHLRALRLQAFERAAVLRLELRMSLLDLVVLRLQRADRLPRRLHLLLGGPFRCLCIRLRLGELRLDVVQLRLAVGELGARRGGIILD